MHRLHETFGDRFQHQPLRRGDSSQAAQVLAAQHSEIGVREQAALQGALSDPFDVAGEVLEAMLRQAGRHLLVVLRPLAGEDQELLGPVAARCPVKEPLDLLRRVQVRLVGGEGAVLAVAATGP